ncbi:hypothetical protein CPC08DRAFT_271885 [Agrocybe pediades]|nr:hypothetical protein CPC08DRAFT_271885 [Agrocybe pediades]
MLAMPQRFLCSAAASATDSRGRTFAICIVHASSILSSMLVQIRELVARALTCAYLKNPSLWFAFIVIQRWKTHVGCQINTEANSVRENCCNHNKMCAIFGLKIDTHVAVTDLFIRPQHRRSTA